MAEDYKERRRFKRVFFPLKDGINVNISVGENEDQVVPAVLLSVGVGGFSIAVQRVKTGDFTINSIIELLSIHDIKSLSRLKNAKAKLKYKIDYDHYVYISYGCEFLSLTDDQKDTISKFVEQRIENLGEQTE